MSSALNLMLPGHVVAFFAPDSLASEVDPPNAGRRNFSAVCSLRP